MPAMLLLAFLAAAPMGPDPTVPAARTAEQQWEALEACPRILTLSGSGGSATGVVLKVRAGYAYLLTAQHATPDADEREVQFFTRTSYPNPARKYRGVEVLKRWEQPDLALMKVTLGPDDALPVLPLAPVGHRPKRFPVEALSVGCSEGRPPTCRSELVIAKRPARRPNNGIAFFWELAVPPLPGRSGGPLLDGDGMVIGICAAAQYGRGYYTHLDEIQAVLARDGFDWLWKASR